MRIGSQVSMLAIEAIYHADTFLVTYNPIIIKSAC